MKLIKLITCLLLVLALALSAVGCVEDQPLPSESSDPAEQSTPEGTEEAPEEIITIELTGSGYTASKSGVVSASGNVLTITAAGKYKITGTLDDAQLRIAVEKTEAVDLVFDALLFFKKTIITLLTDKTDTVALVCKACVGVILTE